MGYADKIVAQNLAPGSAYQEIYKAIWARHFPTVEANADAFWRRVSALSVGERAFIVTNDFYGEIYSNGFDVYFGNTDCQQAHEAADAVSLFGLHQAAAFLRRALVLAQVPDQLPSDYVYEYTEARTAALRELGDEYSRSKPDLRFEEAVVAYVRSHLEEFV